VAGKIRRMIETATYKQVLSRLRVFIRKYYLNKTLQGIILVFLIFAIVLGIFIAANQGLKPSSEWRAAGFWAGSISMALLAVYFIIVPLLQFLGVAGKMDYRSAERIISSHFSEIKDTLLNMLELAGEEKEGEDISLLVASIEEKAERIKWYRFEKAVPIKKLVKFITYVGAVIIAGATLYLAWPDFVKEGYARTVNYKKEFDLPPVYNYKILNDSLAVALGRDMEIRVEPLFDTGEEQVFIRFGQNRDKMEDTGEGFLVHTIKAVNAPLSFMLQYMGQLSESHEISVIPTPELLEFNVQLFPPPYTGIEGKVLNNEGDMDVPAGTQVSWSINAVYADWLRLEFAGDTILTEKSDNNFRAQKRVMNTGKYKIVLGNSKTDEKPELAYNIRVRPDLYPEIDINELRDSLMESQVYFQGFIADDYGFVRLEFNIEGVDGSEIVREELLLNKNSANMRFFHAKDMAGLGREGEQMVYYFSVWDNDEVNGAKRTDSRKMSYRNLSYAEKVEQNKERAEKIEDELSEGINMAEELKSKVDDIKKAKLMSSKEEWEISSKLKEMEEMNMLLEEMLNNIRQENQVKGMEQQSFDPGNERLLQKQEQIQELLEKIMDDELRQLLEEFEKLLEEKNLGNQLEKLDEIESNLENLERQLDVSLELLKRYEIEKEVFRTANELEKISEQLENIGPAQDSLAFNEKKEELKKLEENYKEQGEKNQELKDPMDMDDFDQEWEEIGKDMEEMENSDGGKREEKQKKDKAKKDIKDLGMKMRDMMMGNSGEQDMVDLEILRQLTRQLNDFSFKQEELIEVTGRINAANPEYGKVGIGQRELKEKYSVVRDSLVSIGYKQPMIADLLNKEVFHVETALENLMKHYQNGSKSQVGIEQQQIMTGVNELAVRLDELVQGMENQAGSGGGKGNFTDSKPKSGKEQMGEMKEKQQSLKQQLQGMIQQMKQGEKQGKSNKELARMLAEREMLRQAMEKLQNSGELGEPAKGKLNEIQQLMEEVEKDIIYRRVGEHTIMREKMIETKLLEAEQAEMEREMENKRESTEFKGMINPPDQKVWEEFEKEKKKTIELMKYRDIKLKEFYRLKYFDYLEQLEKQKN